jgi:outer membrane protein assembly factor BamB
VTALFRDNLWRSLYACALCCAVLSGCNTPPATDVTPHATFRAAVLTPTAEEIPVSAQWSGWRGGKLNGVSPAAHLPTMWNDQQGVRWQVEVPGQGNSSPVVWGDSIFLTSTLSTNDQQQGVVLCFDRATGQQRWQQAVGTCQGKAHGKNGFASATVATDGHRVYAAFGSTGLIALNYEGEIIWQLPLAHQRHEWGAAASPLVVDNRVIHVVDGESDAAIVALDSATGTQVWRTPRTSTGSWSSPVLVNAGTPVQPQWQVVVNGTGSASGEVIAYDPKTGAEVWKVRGTSDIPCPTAIVGEGLVVSTSGSNGPIFAIKPHGHGDVTQTHRAWHLPSGGAYVPTGVVCEGRLFLISDAGLATCHDLTSGETLWRKRLHGAFSASLVAAAGHVYAVSERGNVYVFKAGERFELVATNRLHEPCVATPAIASGELYLRTQQHLVCVAESVVVAAEPADVPPVVDAGTIRSPGDVDPSAVIASP